MKSKRAGHADRMRVTRNAHSVNVSEDIKLEDHEKDRRII
jgi:hypothetical protein